ncbi:MAG: DegT/DnrJ/EryC1/StrS family aminotransferase [Kiritimatiellae bacterium]|nr:DegT/DnrJ/EryC1/StrS family aminotransferase [Kiritimatiellia bacterium]
MNVNYSYLKEQFKDYKVIFRELGKLIESGDYTLGKPVTVFERKFADLIGTQHAIGVNSGTDALFLSLKAIGIEPGDEIITAPNTFIATVGAIVAAGARPVFVDVTDEYTINPELIERAITKRTKAIIPVHYAGHPADMKDIMNLADKYGLPIIEDACQAISAAVNKKAAGTFGTTGCFSLHPLKNLNVWGDGGIVTTNSAKVRDKLILFRNHGLKDRDNVGIFGYNSRLDSLQAVVGNYLISSVSEITNTRIKWANRYDLAMARLKDFVTIPRRRPNKKYVYHLYIIMAKRRNQLLSYLNKNNIEAKVHYPIPLHLQKAARNLGYKKGDFPVTEAQCKSIITLPVHQHLSCEQIDYVIQKVEDFYS